MLQVFDKYYGFVLLGTDHVKRKKTTKTASSSPNKYKLKVNTTLQHQEDHVAVVQITIVIVRRKNVRTPLR